MYSLTLLASCSCFCLFLPVSAGRWYCPCPGRCLAGRCARPCTLCVGFCRLGHVRAGGPPRPGTVRRSWASCGVAGRHHTARPSSPARRSTSRRAMAARLAAGRLLIIACLCSASRLASRSARACSRASPSCGKVAGARTAPFDPIGADCGRDSGLDEARTCEFPGEFAIISSPVSPSLRSPLMANEDWATA